MAIFADLRPEREVYSITDPPRQAVSPQRHSCESHQQAGAADSEFLFSAAPNYVERIRSEYARNYRSSRERQQSAGGEVIRINYTRHSDPAAAYIFARQSATNDDEEWPYALGFGQCQLDLTNHPASAARARGSAEYHEDHQSDDGQRVHLRRHYPRPDFQSGRAGESGQEPHGGHRPVVSPVQRIPCHSGHDFQRGAELHQSLYGQHPYTKENPVFAWTEQLQQTDRNAFAEIRRLHRARCARRRWRTGNSRNFRLRRDTNNALDSNYAFSMRSSATSRVTRNSAFRPYSHYRTRRWKWYVQDSWRVSRKLTLDYGLRMYHVPGATTTATPSPISILQNMTSPKREG